MAIFASTMPPWVRYSGTYLFVIPVHHIEGAWREHRPNTLICLFPFLLRLLSSDVSGMWTNSQPTRLSRLRTVPALLTQRDSLQKRRILLRLRLLSMCDTLGAESGLRNTCALSNTFPHNLAFLSSSYSSIVLAHTFELLVFWSSSTANSCSPFSPSALSRTLTNLHTTPLKSSTSMWAQQRAR